MSNTDERSWLWWVLGVLLLGLAAGVFFFQRSSGSSAMGKSVAEHARPPFPKEVPLQDLSQRHLPQPSHKLAPDPQLDRGQSK
jgi:hypothetical protein